MKERRYLDRFRAGDAVYAGEFYTFAGGVAEARSRGGRIAVPLALWWAAMAAYLLTARVTDRCLYALMPLMLSLFPAAYAVMGLMTMLTSPERMTVIRREKGPGRVARAAVGGLVLCAAGTLGCCIRITLSGAWASAWHEALWGAMMTLCMEIVRRRAKETLSALAKQ